jgi:hypothetical protein
MSKPVLVVTTHHVKEVEERIDQNYDARRNPNEAPFVESVNRRETRRPGSIRCREPSPGHDNTLALRAEFKPRAMRVDGVPDL